MPAIGGTDPADLEARARVELGFSRLLEQPRCVAPPPRFGGSSRYPVWYRAIQSEKFHSGEKIQVSLSSIYRWDVCPGPYRQTGNRPRMTVVGVDLLNLVTYITASPDATLDEMAAFIYNKGGNLYSHQAISNRLKDLDVTRKKASTEEYQTQRPDVEFRVWSVWNCPPPAGVLGVPRRKLIDFDEFGVSLEKCNRAGGWAVKVLRVRKDGYYHHGAIIPVIFAIEPGDPQLPPHVRGSVGCVRATGTTANIFRDFCNYVCRDIETNNILGTDFHQILIWRRITAGTYTTRWQTVLVLAIFLSSHDLHTIQSMVPSSTKSVR
jgi:transposase